MAYYSDELIDEIISRADIVNIIDAYVPLKKRGVNYIGLCPFHKEKTPSFTVSKEKQIFKCFGCGQGGSIIQFISKIENLDFRDTLEFLSEKTNIDLSRYQIKRNSNLNNKTKDLKETIFNINNEAAKYFHQALIEQLENKKSKIAHYIKERGLDYKIITRFGLGYGSKKSETLSTYLLKRGYDKESILESGVVSKNIKGNVYESFSERLIFPIFDVRNRVIAFGGRVLNNSLPKYVNSPENIVYYKGKNLYGLNIAKNNNLDKLIIVEGYMDTLALQKNNITNVVATLGTALTENQAKLIKKYTDTTILAYDQDDAGKLATLRAIDILNKEGLKIKVLCLDFVDVKDPDEYINKYGLEKFNACIDKSKSHIEYKIDLLEERLDNTNFDSKLEFLTKTAKILSEIENTIEQDMYLDLISSKHKINREVLSAEIIKKTNKEKDNNLNNNQYVIKKKLHGNLRKQQEQYIIALMILNDKKIYKEIIDNFTENDFENDELKQLYCDIKNIYVSEDMNKINIISKFNNEEKLKVITDIMSINMFEFDKEKLLIDMVNTFRKYRYTKRREEILQKIKSKITKDEKKILEVELNQIIKKISDLK